MKTLNTTTQKSRRLVLSDIDGTLVRGSLVLDHALFLADAGITGVGENALAEMRQYGNEWLDDVKNESAIVNLAESYRRNIVGLTVSDLLVPSFLDATFRDPRNFYSTLHHIVKRRRRGSDVWLISGSPDFLVQPFAAHYRFSGRGSDYHVDNNNKFTGEITGMMGAAAKRDFIATLDVSSYDYVTGYGDTASDIPLFQTSHYTVLVNPTATTSAAVGTVNKVLTV